MVSENLEPWSCIVRLHLWLFWCRVTNKALLPKTKIRASRTPKHRRRKKVSVKKNGECNNLRCYLIRNLFWLVLKKHWLWNMPVTGGQMRLEWLYSGWAIKVNHQPYSTHGIDCQFRSSARWLLNISGNGPSRSSCNFWREHLSTIDYMAVLWSRIWKSGGLLRIFKNWNTRTWHMHQTLLRITKVFDTVTGIFRMSSFYFWLLESAIVTSVHIMQLFEVICIQCVAIILNNLKVYYKGF